MHGDARVGLLNINGNCTVNERRKGMFRLERLGVVLDPDKGQDRAYCLGRKGEFAKYNAGMVLDAETGNRVHMLYRFGQNVPAEEYRPEEGMSPYLTDCLGYAELTPEGKLIADHGIVYRPRLAQELSGCQDPRIVWFEGWYIVTYCAWDINQVPIDCDKPRMAFARTRDFRHFETLGIVDLYAFDKDHYIFPERIGGKICLVHRIAPNIQFDYFDSLNELIVWEGWKNYEEHCSGSTVMRGMYPWEGGKVGGSVPPIRTKEGWLFLYHGVEMLPQDREFEFRYCVGAALLDIENPRRVIARLPEPILCPQMPYEKYGDVGNVVFPVGAYVHEGMLYISYGGADKVTALARCSLDGLLAELMSVKGQSWPIIG